MALLNETVKWTEWTDYTLHAEEINDNVITNYALLVYCDTVPDKFTSL